MFPSAALSHAPDDGLSVVVQGSRVVVSRLISSPYSPQETFSLGGIARILTFIGAPLLIPIEMLARFHLLSKYVHMRQLKQISICSGPEIKILDLCTFLDTFPFCCSLHCCSARC